MSGQRRGLVEQYYHAVDWTRWSDTKRILAVFENVLASLESRATGRDSLYAYHEDKKWALSKFNALKKWIERDGYRYESGRLIPVGKSLDLSEISTTATRFDIPELQRQIDRMRGAIEDDPDLAIGTAKEIVETTCKTILAARGVPYDENDDLLKLVKEARRSLLLVPESIPNSARGAEAVKKIVNSLGVAAHGLAELRNLYGTGHGKHGKAKGLSPRHARLAVSCAAGAENLVRDEGLVPGFDKRFLSDSSLRLLMELENFGIEALDVVLLCFNFVPRKVAQTETFASKAETREQARWLRATARKLRRTLRAAYVPFELPLRQGKIRMVPRGFPALLVDSWHPLFGPITTRTLWEVAGTDENPGLLEECAAILDHHAPLFDRPRSRPPNFHGMLFAREWEELARRKAKRPLDAYGVRLYEVVFGKQVDLDTFRRLRVRVRRAKWAQRIRPRQVGQKLK